MARPFERALNRAVRRVYDRVAGLPADLYLPADPATALPITVLLAEDVERLDGDTVVTGGDEISVQCSALAEISLVSLPPRSQLQLHDGPRYEVGQRVRRNQREQTYEVVSV